MSLSDDILLLAQLPLFRSHARKIPSAFRLHADPTAPAEFD